MIYPSRNLEQTDAHLYRDLLKSDQVHRVYLNEGCDIRQLSLGIAPLVLTTIDEAQALEEARYQLAASRQVGRSAVVSHAIVAIITKNKFFFRF